MDRTFVGLLVACQLAGAGAAGCGGGASEADGAAGSAAAANGCGAAPGGARPPRPGSSNPGDGPGAVFAISKLYLGDTDRDGTPNIEEGFRQYGFDLDGCTSTGASTNLCKPYGGAAPAQVYPDGDGGIDNAWGKLHLPIFLGLAPDFSGRVNETILTGAATVLVAIDGLGAEPRYGPLPARAYTGAALGDAPTLDGSDVWPVRSESLASPPDVSSARLQFPESYVVDDEWVSGVGDDVLELYGWGIRWRIHRPLLTMRLSADRASADRGTIAGIINTEEPLAVVAQGGGDPVGCLLLDDSPSSLLNQLRQASDILLDGTQDPTRECDGISIGLGFEAVRVTLGEVAPAQEPATEPCE